MGKKIGISFSIILIILALASFSYYFTSEKKSIYSDELISTVSLDFKTNLKEFLSKANKTSINLRNGAVGYNNDTLTHIELNEALTKQIKNDELLKGVILFSKNVNYVILREDKTWATTYTTMENDSMLDWTRLDENLNEISHWSDSYNFFMNEKNKNIILKNLEFNGKSVWRVAQSEIPDKRELFVNVFKLKDKNQQEYVIGLLYKTSDIEKNFSKVFMFENPLINIIDESGKLITPIKTTDTSKISNYYQLSLNVENILKNWNINRKNQPYSYSFEKDEHLYWTHIDTLNHESLKGFVITVSENDILQSSKDLRLKFLYLAIGLLILGLSFLIFSLLKRKNNNFEIMPLVKHDNETALQLINAGETEFVEFKSSLRYDYRQEKENKILENVILKSIAAFANAKGGTLFIGVDDDLNILGLENDYSTLKKNDADYFELHLRKLINNQFGISFASESLLVYFPEFENKQICVIQINSSPVPLYLKTKDKQGQPIEKFYVRSGNASQQINSLKEINEYIRRRFGKRY